jgi:hypothetical protein
MVSTETQLRDCLTTPGDECWVTDDTVIRITSELPALAGSTIRGSGNSSIDLGNQCTSVLRQYLDFLQKRHYVVMPDLEPLLFLIA